MYFSNMVIKYMIDILFSKLLNRIFIECWQNVEKYRWVPEQENEQEKTQDQ